MKITVKEGRERFWVKDHTFRVTKTDTDSQFVTETEKDEVHMCRMLVSRNAIHGAAFFVCLNGVVKREICFITQRVWSQAVGLMWKLLY